MLPQSIATQELRLTPVLDGQSTRLLLEAKSNAGAWAPALRRGVSISDSCGLAEAEPKTSGEVSSGAGWTTLALQRETELASLYLSLTLREGSRWIEVVETLEVKKRAPATAVSFLQADWRFQHSAGTLEVFTPNLVPEEGDVIGTHALRAPAITAQSASCGVALATSPEFLSRRQALPPVMNLLRTGDGELSLWVALRAHEIRGHVFYRATERRVEAKILYLHYFIYAAAEPREGEALAAASTFCWERFGRSNLHAARPLPVSYADIAEQVYTPMFKQKWRESVIDGKRVGAITVDRSYFGDVWISTWFNPLQSAYGYMAWGRKSGRQDWIERALAVRNLVLAAPSRKGLFPTLFAFGETPQQNRWVGSHHQGGGPGLLHLMDMSWTIHLLLMFSHDFAPSSEAVQKARAYCQALLKLQRPDGSLPAYVDEHTHATVERLEHAALVKDLDDHPGGDSWYLKWGLTEAWPQERYTYSAEDAASLLAWCDTALALPVSDPLREPFIAAARKSAEFLQRWAFAEHRWLDMELSFSCSPKRLDFYDRRSGQWPQNTLCLNYAALGMLRLYELTREPEHLTLATRALQRLQMYQQVWSPPFLNIDGLGGYGVQNCDGEWSDARQGAFQFTHMEFARVTGDPEQLERAKAACRGSFSTMFIPALAPLYPTGWQRQPRGIAAENHAHGGHEENCVISGFDWGAGSALAAAGYMLVREQLEG